MHISLGQALQQPIALSRLARSIEPILLAERREVTIAADGGGIGADELAVASRGLDQAGLDQAIEHYKRSGDLPTPDHATNTCTLNGYWFERLMEPSVVADRMRRAGFKSTVFSCFWGPGRSSGMRRSAKNALNLISRLSRRLGLRATYYYGIAGVRL